MGLFSKKMCDICGGNMGIVTDNKCSDGKFCHTCAGQLSPWFKGARQATLDQIKEQMADREANKSEVEAFNITRTVGKDMKVLLDEDARKFMVTRASDWRNANPDVLGFSDVTGVNVLIEEEAEEIQVKDKDGNMVSANPPHYKYEYKFSVDIDVNHKYFNEIKFELGSVEIEAKRQGTLSPAGPGSKRGLETKLDPQTNFEYQKLQKDGEEIKSVLLEVRKDARTQAVQAKKPKTPVICPCCGATTLPDAANCCEYCGSPLS